jgi:hypothetical protein
MYQLCYLLILMDSDCSYHSLCLFLITHLSYEHCPQRSLLTPVPVISSPNSPYFSFISLSAFVIK